MSNPLAVGVWSWNLPVNTMNWWPPYLDHLKQQGVSVWLPKILDGASQYNGARLQPAVSYAYGLGISTWAWGYEYDGRTSDPALEAAKLGSRASALGAAALVVDVEAEWTPNDPSVVPFIQACRASFSKPIYFSTYACVSEHPEFPWKEFIALTDGFIPQIYQVPAGERLSKSHGEYRKLAPITQPYLTKKFIPAFYADTTVPYWKPKDTLEGLKAAQTLGAGLATLWASDHMDEAYWGVVRGFTGGGVVDTRTVSRRGV